MRCKNFNFRKAVEQKPVEAGHALL
jgi:hypothetical protein